MEKVAESETVRERERHSEKDQMGRMNVGKMMREMRGAGGGSRTAEPDPSKTNTLITTLHGGLLSLTQATQSTHKWQKKTEKCQQQGQNNPFSQDRAGNMRWGMQRRVLRSVLFSSMKYSS